MAAAGWGGGVSRQGVGRATPAAAAVREKGSSSSSAYVQCRDLVGKSRGGAGGWGGHTAASQHSALQQQLRLGAFGLAALAHALVSQQPVCAGEALGDGGGVRSAAGRAPCPPRPHTYLHAALALVGLLAAVHALMALQVVLLDEAHVAHVALKGLLAWGQRGDAVTGSAPWPPAPCPRTLCPPTPYLPHTRPACPAVPRPPLVPRSTAASSPMSSRVPAAPRPPTQRLPLLGALLLPLRLLHPPNEPRHVINAAQSRVLGGLQRCDGVFWAAPPSEGGFREHITPRESGFSGTPSSVEVSAQ